MSDLKNSAPAIIRFKAKAKGPKISRKFIFIFTHAPLRSLQKLGSIVYNQRISYVTLLSGSYRPSLIILAPPFGKFS